MHRIPHKFNGILKPQGNRCNLQGIQQNSSRKSELEVPGRCPKRKTLAASLAGRAGNAFTSSVFECRWKELVQAQGCCEAALVPLGGNWIRESILVGLRQAYEHKSCAPALTLQRRSPSPYLQKRIATEIIAGLPAFSLVELLSARYGSWVDAGQLRLARSLHNSF